MDGSAISSNRLNIYFFIFFIFYFYFFVNSQIKYIVKSSIKRISGGKNACSTPALDCHTDALTKKVSRPFLPPLFIYLNINFKIRGKKFGK